MRRLFTFLLSLWSCGAVLPGTAATIPLYINSAPVFAPPAIAPQIDATAFLNLSIFDVSPLSSEVPYQMNNNVYFTNRGSGLITGYPGFRWDFFTNGTRRPMGTWFNQGTIQAGGGFFYSPVFNFDGPWLMAWATNLTNRGALQADYTGLIQLQGSNVSIGRSVLATGSPNPAGFGAPPDFGRIVDQYWGVGTNNIFGRVGPNLVPVNGPNFELPSPFSPAHQVASVAGGTRWFTNSTIVVPFNADAWVWTDTLSPTSSVFHIVFAPAVNRDPAIATEVEFSPDPFGDPEDVIVGVNFKFVDYDPINENYFTNGVVIQDSMGFSGNISLVTNTFPLFGASTAIPSVYALGFLGSPSFFSFFPPGTGEPANSTFDSDLIYEFGATISNRVFMPYAGYSAYIPPIASIISSISEVPPFVYSNPSNYPGRIEIIADNLNLDQARIRAESTVIIKSKNVASNHVARVDSPYVNLDLTSTQPVMLISNFTQGDIRRLNGTVSIWSGIWTNYVAYGMETNEVLFHVTMVDNTLQTLATPGVNANEFLVHSTNIVVSDPIRSGSLFLIQASNLTVNGELSLPSNWGWANTNVPGLINLTNHGLIRIPGAGMYGTDRISPYNNFVNTGNNSASSQLIRANRVENTGELFGFNGPVNINATDALLHGITPDFFDPNVEPGFPPLVSFSGTGSQIESGGDVQFLAGSLFLSNAVVIGGTTVDGVMSLFVTNNLTDAGPTATSYLSMHGGVDMRLRPTNSSLLGTTLMLSAGRYEEFFNVWAGEDRGPAAAGYNNNLALGRLVLNFGSNSLNFFSPTTRSNGLPATNAMYVEYLELLNQAADVASTIAINENFTIYFANSNVDPTTIETASGGRMRLVSGFAGAQSSVSYTAANGRVYQMNAALARSMTIDSDGDGIVNGLDSKPFYTADDAVLSVALTSAPTACARLSWTAPARALNTVEYTAAPGSGDWTVLTNFTQGAITSDASILDPLSSTGQLRVYRLRVTPAAQ